MQIAAQAERKQMLKFMQFRNNQVVVEVTAFFLIECPLGFWDVRQGRKFV
jgi:hypothetical protein